MAGDHTTTASGQEESSPEDMLAPASRLGGYRIDRLLGRGGMGEVYEAWDARLSRAVALKRIAGQHAHVASRARLWREARALAALRHPAIPAIYEIAEDADSGRLFLAMELVRGRPLSDLGARRLPPRLAARVAHAVAAGAGAAHAAGIVHRDIKPANVLIEEDGTVRLVDFGLALRASDGDERLTHSGALLGTPGYMAPEALDPNAYREVGPAADVFAIGTMLYRLLTGVHPFARDSAQATAMAIAGSIHQPVSELLPTLPTALAALVERCLAVSPAARPPDGAALAALLDAAICQIPAVADEAAERHALTSALKSDGLQAAPAPPDTAESAARPEAPLAKAPSPRRTWRRVWIGAGLVVAAGVAIAVLTTRSSEGPTAVTTASVAPYVLPPRPVVAVLGFRVARPADAARAEVLADVLRVRLDEVPEQVLAPSLDLTRALVASGPAIGPDLAPELLARTGRPLGHVDLVVRGDFRDADASGPARATLELVATTSGQYIATVAHEAADVMTLADDLATALLPKLGAKPPAHPVALTRVPEAWTALMAARAADLRADLDAASDNVAWALRLDPAFGLARFVELPLLHQHAREEELVQKASALLDADRLAGAAGRPVLTAHARAHIEALVPIVTGRLEDGIQRLHAIIERWPLDLEAADLLMAVRSRGRARDLDEVEKLARRQLGIAPRLEVPASRLIRALGFRGRGDEADRVIVPLGVPRSDPAFFGIYAELDLFAGRFAEAAEGFREVFMREPGNYYAEHMIITADLLGGRFGRAAQAALDRIERTNLLGKDSRLSWTYSLASQALIGWEQWDGLEKLLRAWEELDEDGRTQVFALRERVAMLRQRLLPEPARAAEAERLAARWRGLLDDPSAVPSGALVTLKRLLIEVVKDADWLTTLARAEEARMVDRSLPSIERAGARQLVALARARLSVMAGRAPEETRRAYDEVILPLSEVQGEAETIDAVVSLTARAEALAALGDAAAARRDWEAVVKLGYPRLWVTDAWVLARHRLE